MPAYFFILLLYRPGSYPSLGLFLSTSSRSVNWPTGILGNKASPKQAAEFLKPKSKNQAAILAII